MDHGHHNDTLYSCPKLISLLCISWENDTHLDRKVSWIGCLLSCSVDVFLACVTVTQSGNLTPNRRPCYNDVCWTGDGVVAIYGGPCAWLVSVIQIYQLSFAMYFITTRGQCGTIFITVCFNHNPMWPEPWHPITHVKEFTGGWRWHSSDCITLNATAAMLNTSQSTCGCVMIV